MKPERGAGAPERLWEDPWAGTGWTGST